MKALVKSKAEPGLWLEDVPQPKPGINDVLIRIEKTAICGTDVHIWNWDEWSQATIHVPMVVGYEFVGRVATAVFVAAALCGLGQGAAGQEPALPSSSAVAAPPPASASAAAGIGRRVGSSAYVGIGLDSLDTVQYEAVGTDFDWGLGKGPGGGMLISFVDPDSEARAKGVCWGDILVAVDWGKGGAQPVGAIKDFELAMAQIQPEAALTLQIFKGGQVRSSAVRATAWPSRALEVWPARSGKGPYYFPWLKDRPALVDYRVTECLRAYRTGHAPLALKDAADAHFLTGRYAEAVKAYETYFSEHPGSALHYPALYALAYAARMSGQWEKARQAAEEAVAVRPTSYLALYEWARALHQLGRSAGALNCIDNALKILPPQEDLLRESFQRWRAKIASEAGAEVPRARTPKPSPTPGPLPPQASSAPVQLPRAAKPAGPPASSPAALGPADSGVGLLAPGGGADQAPLLTIESLQSLLQAKPGAHVLVVVEYQVGGLADGATANVAEIVRLKRGEEVFQTWTQSSVRRAGHSRLNVVFMIPANLAPGDYELEATVCSGLAQARQSVTLKVSGAEE